MLLLWMVSINLRGSFSYEMSWLLQVLSRFWQLGPWSFRWNVWRPPPSTYLKVASNLIIWKIFNISCHFDSRAFVASLPREKVSCAPDEEQQCPICLKAVEEGDRYQFYRKTFIINGHILITPIIVSLMTLPCCHAFHDACVTAWLGKAANCPLCRFFT